MSPLLTSVLLLQLPEHISSYSKTWLDFTNEKKSISLSLSASKHIQSLLASHAGAPSSILTAAPRPLAETVSPPPNPSSTQGLEDAHPWMLHKTLLDHHLSQSALQYSYGNRQQLSPAMPSMILDSGKRRAETDPSDDVVSSRKKRKVRSCTSCHSKDCPSHWNVQRCLWKTQAHKQSSVPQSPIVMTSHD